MREFFLDLALGLGIAAGLVVLFEGVFRVGMLLQLALLRRRVRRSAARELEAGEAAARARYAERFRDGIRVGEEDVPQWPGTGGGGGGSAPMVLSPIEVKGYARDRNSTGSNG